VPPTPHAEATCSRQETRRPTSWAAITTARPCDWSDFTGKPVVLWFFPKGRHTGVNGGGLRVSRPQAGLRHKGSRRPRRLLRYPRREQGVRRQVPLQLLADLRHRSEDRHGLRRQRRSRQGRAARRCGDRHGRHDQRVAREDGCPELAGAGRADAVGGSAREPPRGPVAGMPGRPGGEPGDGRPGGGSRRSSVFCLVSTPVSSRVLTIRVGLLQ
jgi:hypothetical protein